MTDFILTFIALALYGYLAFVIGCIHTTNQCKALALNMLKDLEDVTKTQLDRLERDLRYDKKKD
jgi:hypothetical protein